MITILKEDLTVNDLGRALIPLDLSNFINPELEKVPFQFNDSENQIIIKAGINAQDIKIYEENYKIQNRKYLHFKVVENVKKNKQKFKRVLEKIKISLDDPEKLEETLESIKRSYILERSYTFFFNRSKYIKKFFNTNFDLHLLKSEGKVTEIIFNFKSIYDITPRTLTKTISQGTLVVHKEAPPKLIKTFLNKKNYAIVKIFSLMELHSEEFKNTYDILITPNENIINRIYKSKDYDNPNAFFGTYSKDGGVNTQNFYISKLKFSKFLKPHGNITLYVKEKESDNRKALEFNDRLYGQFLTNFNYYSLGELEKIKEEKSRRGISEYYSHIYDFLLNIKSKEFKCQKYRHKLVDLLDRINEFDFSDITKREVFNVEVSAYFMDNMEILVSQDSELKIDYTLNLLEVDFNYIFEKGFTLFKNNFQNLIDKSEIHKISEENYKDLFSLIKDLKFRNLINFPLEFIKDFFYFFSILKNNISIVKNHFDLRNNALLEAIPLLLSCANVFRNYFPKNYLNTHMDLYFASKFESFTEINQEKLFKIKKFCRDVIFLFLAAQSLKLIKKTFKEKFQRKGEFDHIIRKIEALIEPKANVQNIFDKLLLELENGIKKDVGINFNEITKLLQEQLKDEFSSQSEFENTTKTIENILKSKIAPAFDYSNTLKEIDLHFKQNLTSEKDIQNTVHYIEENLKKSFYDKKKFAIILNNIRNTYELKIENTRKYSRILKHINKGFTNLTSEADIQKIKKYIDKNLEDIFDTPSQHQSTIRQIDKAFKDRIKNPQELEDIIKLCFGVIRLLLADAVSHNILTASVFGLFILAIDKDKKIPLESICSLLKIQPSSLNLHVKKIIEDYTDKKGKRFEDLKIKNQKTREKIRYKLADLLLNSQVHLLFKSVEDKNRDPEKLVNEFQFRLDFFLHYVQFDEALNSVSKLLIDKFIMNYIEVITKEMDSKKRKLLISNLRYRINFFNNYNIFRGYLSSLKVAINAKFVMSLL